MIRRGNTPTAEKDMKLLDVIEEHGLTPWYFNLPDRGQGYEAAWRHVLDPQILRAPYGPTTADQRHPAFLISYEGHECQWKGPSWPYSTAATLTAMANLLNHYQQSVVTKADYRDALRIYSNSHRRPSEDGKILPWIDENLHP